MINQRERRKGQSSDSAPRDRDSTQNVFLRPRGKRTGVRLALRRWPLSFQTAAWPLVWKYAWTPHLYLMLNVLDLQVSYHGAAALVKDELGKKGGVGEETSIYHEKSEGSGGNHVILLIGQHHLNEAETAPELFRGGFTVDFASGGGA